MVDTLPPRPTAAEVADALSWASRDDGTALGSDAVVLAAEVLHLREELADEREACAVHRANRQELHAENERLRARVAVLECESKRQRAVIAAARRVRRGALDGGRNAVADMYAALDVLDGTGNRDETKD